MQYGNQSTGAGTLVGQTLSVGPRSNGGELSGIVQRAQKLADLAQQASQRAGGVDQMLGSLPSNVAAAPNQLDVPQSHVAAMHEALDRAEQALGYTISQLDRLNTALA